ncbi:hypothetical protein H4R33_005560 [Dimargaris cristalligena]|nr:hypothetical protein H4R33_005560 [Dimargaris cristalligena]
MLPIPCNPRTILQPAILNHYVFPLTTLEAPVVERLKIIFPESTDFFGRITIYRLDIIGIEA